MSFSKKYISGFEVEIKREQAHLFQIDSILENFSLFLEEHTNNKVDRKENIIEFTHINPLFLFSFKSFVEIKYEQKLIVKYRFSLKELIQIVGLLVLFVIFFSQYTLYQYLIVSTVFVVAFFVLNMLIINSDLYKLLKAGAKKIIAEQESDFSQEQQEWLANEEKCPACGCEVTIYDKNCPDCSVKLRDSAPTKPYSISGDFQRIKYHLKAE